MKRLIAVSDSHGMVSSLQNAVQLATLQGKIDIFVFLGDGMRDFEEIQPVLLQHNPRIHLVAVRGNNDFSSSAPVLEEIRVNGRILLATHGHSHHVKFGLNRLSYAARQRHADLALYGHTHVSRLEEAYGIWFINPGAICHASTKSSAFGEILIEEDGTIRPNLYDWSGTAL